MKPFQWAAMLIVVAAQCAFADSISTFKITGATASVIQFIGDGRIINRHEGRKAYSQTGTSCPLPEPRKSRIVIDASYGRRCAIAESLWLFIASGNPPILFVDRCVYCGPPHKLRTAAETRAVLPFGLKSEL
jgi:hypothetical protein